MSPSLVRRQNGDVYLGEANTEQLLSCRRRIVTGRSDGRSSDGSDVIAPSTEDSELLDAWRTGQNAAGQVLLERHCNDLRGFLRRHAGDLADDLLQETLMVGVSQRDRFRGDSSFRTYLFGIAKNLLRRTRQRQKHLPDMQSLGDGEALDLGIDGDQGRDPLLFAAMKKLRRQDQLVVQQYFWDERTGPEIAHSFGISERTVRSRLHRALARLRVVLMEMDDEIASTD